MHTRTQIEESAKKSVESATGSAALKLYNRWHEKVEEGESEGVQGEDEQKKKKEKRSSRSEVCLCMTVWAGFNHRCLWFSLGGGGNFPPPNTPASPQNFFKYLPKNFVKKFLF